MSEPSIAIACATGGFKGVFLTGVLKALRSMRKQVQAYAASSSAVLPAAFAATGDEALLSADYWQEGRRLLELPGYGMSQMVLDGISRYGPRLRRRLFRPGTPDFMVAASAVTRPEAAELTQGKDARRLGRRLLLAAARKEREWVDANLKRSIFATFVDNSPYFHRLTAANFQAVAYASSRMLHAWDIPAWVDGHAYVDAAYTCSCPAIELAELGFDLVVALVNEPGGAYRDIFGIDPLPDTWGRTAIRIIKPDFDPVEAGVDYTRATEAGIASVFAHGVAKGEAYLLQAGRHWTN